MDLAIPVRNDQVPPPEQVQQMNQEMIEAGSRRISNLTISFASYVVGTTLVLMSLESASKTNDLSNLFFAALGALQAGHGVYKFARNWPTPITHQIVLTEQCTDCIQLFFIAISIGLFFKIGMESKI